MKIFKLKSGRIVEYLEVAPEGWIKIEGATATPNGFDFYSNGESLFGEKFKSVLVKNKDFNLFYGNR